MDTELRNKYPCEVADQASLEIMSPDGSTKSIRPDNLVKQPNDKLQIIDAKHQMDGFIASGQKTKGPFTENQSVAYLAIADGKASAIAKYDIPDLGIKVRQQINLSTDIRIHTYDIAGKVVDLHTK